ncbi:MAG: hypothetical protein ACOCQQ_00810 [Candidatus Nanoarchaeia archaeon]
MELTIEPINSLDELMHMSQDNILMFNYFRGDDLFAIAGYFSNYDVNRGVVLSNVNDFVPKKLLKKTMENSKNNYAFPEFYDDCKKNISALFTPEYFADTLMYKLDFVIAKNF